MFEFERVESLFHEALLLPAGVDRAAWMRERCQGDGELLEEVQSLLDAHTKITAGVAAEALVVQKTAIPAAEFGAYRAVELVGRGGMSAVYRARRADGRFDQTVALKIMAAHPAAPEFLRRFETERQLLASLSHNNITRLLDGGVSSAGDPYLITEYVEGQTLDRYCD